MRTFPMLISPCRYPERYIDNHPTKQTNQLKEIPNSIDKRTEQEAGPSTGQLSGALRFYERLALDTEDVESEGPDIWLLGRGITKNRPVVLFDIAFLRNK
jgi:hypothetical protein